MAGNTLKAAKNIFGQGTGSPPGTPAANINNPTASYEYGQVGRLGVDTNNNGNSPEAQVVSNSSSFLDFQSHSERRHGKHLLIAAFLIGMHASLIAEVGEFQPIDIEGWNKEQGYVEQVRNEFILHVKGAKNIRIPATEEAFAWKINWKRQQAYCKNIADALFKNPHRLSFPEPSFSGTRDSSKKLYEVLYQVHQPIGESWHPPRPSPEQAASEFEKAISAETARQGRVTRMLAGPCDVAYWQRTYVGKESSGVYQFSEMVNPDPVGRNGNTTLCRPTEVSGIFMELTKGDWLVSTIWGSYPNDTSADDRTETSKAIVGAIDSSPVIFEFGTYTFPVVRLGELEPAKSDWGKPLYGKKGQRYVLVAHPQKNFENPQARGGFAVIGPLADRPGARGHQGWPDPKFGNDSSRYACFINFDSTESN